MLASLLIRMVGFRNEKCGVKEMRRLQELYLTPLKIRLVIFNRRRHSSTSFRGPVTLEDNIYLYQADQHVNVVTSPTAFVCQSYFCQRCLKPYSHHGKHRCQITCWRCQKPNKKACVGPLRQCNDCHRWMAGDTCFNQHKTENTCTRTSYCSNCSVYLQNLQIRKTHICGQKVCYRCQSTYKIDNSKPHQCFRPDFIKKRQNSLENVLIHQHRIQNQP